MARFVGGVVIVFVIALGFVVVTAAQDLAALFEAFRAEPLWQKLAWFVIVLIPLALIPSAVWLCDALGRQHKAIEALELRLGGVKQGVKSLAAAQVDADAAIHHLARTDPENAIAAVAARLGEAERVAQVQDGRNEIGDLQLRVDALRAQQERLRERLVPMLEKRRAIERLFAELDGRERDIDNALAEIATGDDAVAIEVRLNGLTEFVRAGHAQGDAVEQAAKTLAELKNDFQELRQRLAPYAAKKDGIAHRIKELGEARDRLAAGLHALLESSDGTLVERVQRFAEDKARLQDGVATLGQQFSNLATLRKEVTALAAKFDRAIDSLGIAAEAKGDVEARLAELSAYIRTTQGDFDRIERTMADLDALRTQLDALQTRLKPLDAADGGIVDLVAQVKDIRDRLAAKISRIEADEEGGLAARVTSFVAAKQELEQRVTTVTEQFSKLATIRNDIAGLFDKLSSAADTSSSS